MSNSDETTPGRAEAAAEQLKLSFGKVLNQHGYGFQYSVIKKAWELCGGGSQWLFEASEFPVTVQGGGTRIDFILARARDFRAKGLLYLLAECKRANPALSNWCFARSPFVHEGRIHSIAGYEPIILERAELNEKGAVRSSAKMVSKLENAYHLARDIKSGQKGDESGAKTNEQAIEEAASQVCRGLNGMVEFFVKNPQLLKDNTVSLLPAIFTTARIWVSDVDLSSAAVETGKVDLKDTKFQERPWIALQYHLSPGIKHTASPTENPASLHDFMDSEYVRTIPIVSPAGIEPFLKWSSQIDLRW
jgi:hypothetical protein